MNEALAPPSVVPMGSNLGPPGAEPLRQALLAAISGSEDAVRFDGGAVDKFGTGALQVLLAAAAQLKRAGRRLVIESPSPQLAEWIRLAGCAGLVK